MKKAGETFHLAGLDWKILEITEQGYKCLAEKLDFMQFDQKQNNWKESDLRKYLNKEFLEKLEAEIGKENIISFERNLTSFDGQTEFGTCEDKVSLLDVDEYQKYHISNTDDYWWLLLTPWSTPSNGYDYDIQVTVVSSTGDIYWSFHDRNFGVRPVCIFSPAIFESENDSKPECFTPEKNMCYPLCVGGKGLKCEKCCLYTNFEPDEA